MLIGHAAADYPLQGGWLSPPGSPSRAFSRASSSLITHDAGCEGGYR
jgi:hypothetical protein